MDVTIPMTAQNLRHQLRNLATVAGRCLGQDSIIYGSLLKIQEHTENHEVSYQFKFKNYSLFDGTLLDKINWWIHRFLESCAHGTVSKIKKSKLKFDDIMEQIEQRDYNSKSPARITGLTKKRELQKDTDNNTDTGGNSGNFNSGGRNGGGGGKEKHHRTFQPWDDSKKVSNNNQCDSCKLHSNERFRDIFHPGNIRGLERPKRNGFEFCLRFQTIGYWFADCKYKTCNVKLTEGEEEQVKRLVSTARQNVATYSSGMRNNSNSRNNNNPSANGTTAGTGKTPIV